eukprot:12347825-Karenia_brevis.AAC.1
MLDSELMASGGAARFDMDDGYAIGPANVVFDAVARFSQAVADLGLELRNDKSRCFSFGVDLMQCVWRPRDLPIGSALTIDGRRGVGIVVGGIPVGDD